MAPGPLHLLFLLPEYCLLIFPLVLHSSFLHLLLRWYLIRNPTLTTLCINNILPSPVIYPYPASFVLTAFGLAARLSVLVSVESLVPSLVNPC